jgi:hypothetical protein
MVAPGAVSGNLQSASCFVVKVGKAVRQIVTCSNGSFAREGKHIGDPIRTLTCAVSDPAFPPGQGEWELPT